jgi:hypothetical protein
MSCLTRKSRSYLRNVAFEIAMCHGRFGLLGTSRRSSNIAVSLACQEPEGDWDELPDLEVPELPACVTVDLAY